MLIRHKRHTQRDLDHWELCERIDAANACRLGTRIDTRIKQAKAEILDFISMGAGGYLGVSWGKDSVVCAWILHQIEASRGVSLPVVWVVLEGWQNPDSHLVRDAFLDHWPLRDYHEIRATEGETTTERKEERLVHGFAEASRRFGDRYVSGVRADESVTRKMSVGHHGLTTSRVCRPIGNWSTEMVFALCYRENLPLHPAYACTMGGMLERNRQRTANIGGTRGTEFGRREWERRYYPEVFSAIARNHRGSRPDL